MILKTALCALILFGKGLNVFSQNGNYAATRSFTVADGLPSNHIYTCVEDDHGFLWIATDAGIARFDGKNFQVFTTQQGLPDNEVLNVVKENNGRIWVNCFKQSPSYFDETRNRFVNAKEDSSLAKVNGTNLIYLSALPNGGVMYNNEQGSYIFEDKKCSFLTIESQLPFANVAVKRFPDKSFITIINNSDTKILSLLYITNGRIADSVFLLHYNNYLQLRYFIAGDKIYFQNESTKGYYILSGIHAAPLSYTLDSMDIGKPAIWLNIKSNYISVVTKSGQCLDLDKRDNKLIKSLDGDFSPNAIYHDRAGNIWISSIDKGLFLFKKKQVDIVQMPAGFTNNFFLSIGRKPDGNILAGNYFSEIVESGHGVSVIHKLPQTGLGTGWQRKIICSQQKVFTFSEGGSYCNYELPLLYTGSKTMTSKTAAVLNDSMLVEGSFGTLRIINTKTNKLAVLNVLQKRCTAICTAPGPLIYHGSTDGLYKFDCYKNTDIDISNNHPLLSERVTALTATTDGFVWVGTASKGVLQLQNDKVVNIFSTATGMSSDNVKCLLGGKPGELWVGTNDGISIIRYQKKDRQPACENISVCDGLSSNIINEMLLGNDSVFCATANGVCVLPVSISLPVYDIPVRLTRIMINNRDTIIDSAYQLRYYENSLQLHFAGIEPGGHFDYFQYKVDEGAWNNLEGNFLDLQLNSGKHTIGVRAVNMNGQYSSKALLLHFKVAIVFWKSPLLWIAVVAAGFIFFGWLLRRREIAKREIALQSMLSQKRMAELELQALKSQIDPHFIFNCLNSIKMLNHKEQYGTAENYLDRFAALLRSALEQSSTLFITLQEEINFIGNYLALEKLRFPNRLFYQVEKEGSIDAGNIIIPTMLLQPYIENSIRHGIGPLKDRPGIINIRFKQEGQTLVAEVEDNGVGINTDANSLNGKGIGIMNTQRRCKLYNIEYSVSNIRNTEEQVCGTVIRLLIPLKHTHKSV